MVYGHISSVIMVGHLCIACNRIVHAFSVIVPISPYKSLCNSILPMGTNGTRGKVLLLLEAGFTETFSSVDAIVSTNCSDLDIVSGGKGIKFCFGGKKLMASLGFMKVGIHILGVVINPERHVS